MGGIFEAGFGSGKVKLTVQDIPRECNWVSYGAVTFINEWLYPAQMKQWIAFW